MQLVALGQTLDGDDLPSLRLAGSDQTRTGDAEVLWALATHCQPHRDLFVVDGLPGSPLDPSSSADGTTSRMGLDATRGPDFDGQRIVVSASARELARTVLS